MTTCGTNQKAEQRLLAVARSKRPSMRFSITADDGLFACENQLMEAIYDTQSEDAIAGHRTSLCVKLQALVPNLEVDAAKAVQEWENAMRAVKEARACNIVIAPCR
jgi:hypothetical protein